MTGGAPTARDLAFFFGAPSAESSTEAGTVELVDTEAATTKADTTEAAAVEVTITKVPTAKVTGAGGTSTQDKEIGISSYGRKRSYAILEEDEVRGGKDKGNDEENQDEEEVDVHEDEEVDEDEDVNGEEDMGVDVDEKEEEENKKQNGHDGNKKARSEISFVWPKPEEVVARRKLLVAFENRAMFVGNFSTFDDALRKTGMSYRWLQTKYIERLITIEGRWAKVLVMKGRGRCRACIDYNAVWGNIECRVLVRHPSNALHTDKCGHCLKVDKPCPFEKLLK
jgi:hypothetical protein